MGKELFFLIDTGAKISILKKISDFFKYVRNNNTIKIQGLSQELTKSKALKKNRQAILDRAFSERVKNRTN